jgi:hypothetical protein
VLLCHTVSAAVPDPCCDQGMRSTRCGRQVTVRNAGRAHSHAQPLPLPHSGVQLGVGGHDRQAGQPGRCGCFHIAAARGYCNATCRAYPVKRHSSAMAGTL